MTTSQLENVEAASEVAFAILMSSSPSPESEGFIDEVNLSSIAHDVSVADESFHGDVSYVQLRFC